MSSVLFGRRDGHTTVGRSTLTGGGSGGSGGCGGRYGAAAAAVAVFVQAKVSL